MIFFGGISRGEESFDIGCSKWAKYKQKHCYIIEVVFPFGNGFF